MTKLRLLHIFFLLLIATVKVMSQGIDSLSMFVENNPNAVDYNIIYEGTKLNLSADDENLLVNISIAHPALQMRFLMQPARIYIDSSGKKKKRHQIILPCAMDVKEELEREAMIDEGMAEQNTRPDIMPLLSALNRRGAEYVVGKRAFKLGYQRFYIEVDQMNDLVNIYVLIPKERLMNEKRLSDTWSIGVFSSNDMANMPPPGQDGEMDFSPLEEIDESDILPLMQSEIKQWVSFSIDDVNNVNLK